MKITNWTKKAFPRDNIPRQDLSITVLAGGEEGDRNDVFLTLERSERPNSSLPLDPKVTRCWADLDLKEAVQLRDELTRAIEQR